MAEEKKKVVEVLDGEAIKLSREPNSYRAFLEKTVETLRTEFGKEFVFRGEIEITLLEEKSQSEHLPLLIFETHAEGGYSNYHVCPADPYLLLKLAQKIFEKYDLRRQKN